MAKKAKDDKPAGTAQAAAPSSASDDPKERFRQALEAKKHRGSRGGSGPSSGDAGSKGSSIAAGGRREFRRKSG